MPLIMASCDLFFTFVTLSTLLFFVSASHDFPSQFNFEGAEVSLFEDPEKVNLSLYYEALCPYSAEFIIKDLTEVFQNHLITIINLRLVPWGNAHINQSNNSIVCQHGQDECLLNAVEACAIKIWKDVNKHYGLIYCIEFLVIEGKYKDWNTCFNSLGLPEKHVLDCYHSGNGRKLELAYGNETSHLNPPHTFVPWVVVNDQPIRDDYKNFVAYVCKAYKGKAVPSGCKLLQQNANFRADKANISHDEQGNAQAP